MNEFLNDTVKLTLMRHAVDKMVDPAGYPGHELEFLQQEINLMAARLNRDVWTEKKPEHTFKNPDGWIEAIKDRWMPEWAKRRWPVRMRSVIVTCSILYPALAPSLPNEKSVIEMEITRFEPGGYKAWTKVK